MACLKSYTTAFAAAGSDKIHLDGPVRCDMPHVNFHELHTRRKTLWEDCWHRTSIEEKGGLDGKMIVNNLLFDDREI